MLSDRLLPPIPNRFLLEYICLEGDLAMYPNMVSVWMSQLFEKKITHHLRRTSSDVEAKQIDHAGKADDSIDRAPVYTSIVQGLNENFQVSKNLLRLGFFL